MFGWISEPYDQISLRTTLSEEAFCKGLERECLSRKKTLLSFRGIRAAMNTKEFHFALRKKRGQEIQLQPLGRGKNSLRGNIFIAFESDPETEGTILNVVIRPEKYVRWFCRYFFGALCLWEASAIAIAIRYGGNAIVFPFFGAIGFFGGFLVMKITRSMAEGEVPRLRESFAKTLGRIEQQAKEIRE